MDVPQVPTIIAVLVGKAGCGKRTIFEAYARETVEKNSPALEENRARPSDQLCDQQGNAMISNSCIARMRTIGRTQVQVLLHWINMGKEGEPMNVSDIPAISNARAVIYVFDLLNDPTFAGAGDVARAVSNTRRIMSLRAQQPLNFIIGAKSDAVNNAEFALTSAAPFLSTAPRYAVAAKTDPQHAAATIDQIIVAVKAQMDSSPRLTTRRTAAGKTPVATPSTPNLAYGTGGEQVERIKASAAAKTLSNTDVGSVLPVEQITPRKPPRKGRQRARRQEEMEEALDARLNVDTDWEESRPCVACTIV